jgi:inner membrane protein
MIGLFTAGLLSHDLLDTFTVYGIGLLEPFSGYRFATSNIFVADPFYTLPLLVSCLVVYISRSNERRRQIWNAAGLIISSIYLVFTFVFRAEAANALHTSLNEKNLKASDWLVAPTLLNSFAWNGIAADSGGFWIGYYSVFQDEKTMPLHFIPVNEQLLGEMKNSTEVTRLKEFSQGFYCITREKDTYWFNDMRFGQVGGWSDPKAPFAFSFNLTTGADNSMVVQKGRIDGSRREMLKSLWDFIFRNENSVVNTTDAVHQEQES